MKRALSASALACAALSYAVGCSSAGPSSDPMMPVPSPTGGNGDVGRGGDWPGSNPTPPSKPSIPSPIILAHGFSGFHNIGPIDYFYGVKPVLEADGHTVFVTQVDPFNDSYVRGAQLQTQVEAILAETGAPHVILIGHSQGALDVRYVAHNLGGKVSAAVLVAGPNRGDPVADVALGDLPGPVQSALDVLLQLFGTAVLDPGGNISPDAHAALYAMSTVGANEFNAKYPDSPEVTYFSFAGRANSKLGDTGCQSAIEPGWVAQWDQKTDATTALMSPFAAILNQSAPLPLNDGLVTVASAKWGNFMGCLPADHVEQVCQIANPTASSGFKCADFYRTLVNWLVAQGY
jgi:triacylglycerol lipase